MPPRRESRRPFGRPTEAPGPVETFESSFQIPPAAAPQPDSSHQILRLSQTGELLASSASQRRQRQRSERGQVAGRDAGAGSSLHGGRLPSVGAHDAASSLSTAPASTSDTRTRQANDVLPESGPSKRRRPSHGAVVSAPGHRQTQSTPTVPVSAAQHPGSNFHRSSSSTVLPSEMPPEGGGPLTGPRSWPRTLTHLSTGPLGQPSMLSPISPTSPLAYRGGNRQTPSTSGSSGRGEFSPQGPPSSNRDDLPSTGAQSLTSPHMLYPRAGEVSDLSPIRGTTWQYPTSAPQTPGSGSYRAPSLPPTSASPSPNLGMVGDFDFDLPPGFPSPYEHPRTISGVRAVHDDRHHTRDPSDLAPLPPDQFPANMMLTQNPVYAHLRNTTAAASRHSQVAFYGQQYPHGSISGTLPPPHPLMNRRGLPGEVAAPDLTETEPMCWPSSLFGEEDLIAYSHGAPESNLAQQEFMPMSAPYPALGSSRSGYYAPPAPPSHAYVAQAGLSYPQAPTGPPYSPAAGHPYSSQGAAALYASQTGRSPYAAQGGSSYPPEAGPSYSSQRRSSAH